MAIQYLFHGLANSEQDIKRAFDRMEAVFGKTTNGNYCYRLGFAYENGRGRTPDKIRAREAYFKGFTLGDTAAAKNLARMQLSGEGGPIDFQAGALSLERACEAGDADCCMHLAYAYHQGTGVERDERRAMELLEKACNLGSVQACESFKNLKKGKSANPVAPQPR